MPDSTDRPDWNALVRARLGDLPLDAARAADVVDELAQHAAQHYAELMAGGADHADALARALSPLRDPETVAREIARADRPRAAAPVPPPDAEALWVDVARDVTYAVRVLSRTPGFTLACLLTLALGIGANTAMFSVVNAVLIRPLPYADPDRLFMIGTGSDGGAAGNVGYATFVDWRDRAHSFEDMAVIRLFTPTALLEGRAERLSGMRVSANFFRLLGVKPILGRDFREDEGGPAGWHVVMLSDTAWRQRFGGDPSVVGRVIQLSDLPFTIVGIMPATFEPLISEHFYQRADFWAPLGYDTTLPYACRDCQHLHAMARVKRGVSAESARADAEAVQRQLRRDFPKDYPSDPMTLVPLRDELTAGVRPALFVLFGAVGFVLLIACANVANLMLARVSRREREVALRSALGASRARLVRQLLIESGVLALASGALGIALGTAAVPLLVRMAPASMSRLTAAGLDGRVLVFSCVVSLLTAVLFGTIPAVHGSRLEPQSSLQGEGRRTAHAPTSLARRTLVAADVAMAVVLLIGAGLMLKSVGRLLGVDPGFDPDRVLTMQVSLLGKAYAQNDAVVARTDQMLERLGGLPGVEGVAIADQIPLGGNYDTRGFHIQGREWGPLDPSVQRYAVTPGYFTTLRIPLKRGRLITAADRGDSPPVLLIGERTARSLWPAADPIGQRVKIGGVDGPWYTIVGIVGDVRHDALASPTTLQMYEAQAQSADQFLTVIVRTSGDPSAVAADARRAIASVAGDIPVDQVAPLADLVRQSVGPRRFLMLLLEVFGGIALLMTAIGVYGVVAYSVGERTREIGIRAALGASSADIMRLVFGDGMIVIAAGLAAGVAVSMAVTRYLEGSLFNISATDPATFAAVAIVLLVVSLAAQMIPVLRAIRIDPTVALRQD